MGILPDMKGVCDTPLHIYYLIDAQAMVGWVDMARASRWWEARVILLGESLLLLIEHGIGILVVIHLHLLVDFHEFAAAGDVIKQGVDSLRQVFLLFKQDGEFLSAAFAMVSAGVGALSLFLHVIDLQIEDAEAVYGPGRALCIDGGVGLGLYLVIFGEEIAVNAFHKIRAVLITFVDSPFQHHRIDRVDVGVANDILKMPLYRVYPGFEIQVVLNGSGLVRVADWGVHVVSDVISIDSLVENVLAEGCKFHTLEC